jgi:2-methylcitrate dehydratase PrpD
LSDPANPTVAYGAWLAEAGGFPSEALEMAQRHFVDTLAVTIRGAEEEAPLRALGAVAGWGSGDCTVIGACPRLPAPWAAMVNGTAAHVLDFDDNFDPGKAHASAVLVPAILALAEQEDLSGGACLDAYVAGLQILGRVGEGLNPVHRTRGWHATGTLGAVGAAAACARLLQLDGRQAAFALSIATSMAGGFMSQLGSMMKPIHAGLAAKAGILAATFARSGVDAGLGTLEGPTGMTGLMVGQDYEALRAVQPLRFETEAVGEPLLVLTPGLRVKRFPNCASAHRAMEALLDLRARHGFAAAEVEQVVVRAPSRQFANLMFTDPASALEGKLSLEFALAVILLEGDFTLSHVGEETVARGDVRALYGRIKREPFEEAPSGPRAEVAVTLTDGRRFEACVVEPFGSPSRPFGAADYWRKFDACLHGFLPDARLAALRDALERLPELPSVRALMVPLAG